MRVKFLEKRELFAPTCFKREAGYQREEEPKSTNNRRDSENKQNENFFPGGWRKGVPVSEMEVIDHKELRPCQSRKKVGEKIERRARREERVSGRKCPKTETRRGKERRGIMLAGIGGEPAGFDKCTIFF